MSNDNAIEVKDLRKTYKKMEALRGVDFTVSGGTILALLGPNGAGKTTTIRILSTLLIPNGGRASVNGFDVVRQPRQVRASIGLTGQFAAVDEYLTGLENLQMIGRLYRLASKEAKRRSLELLEQFDLTEAADRRVKTYSGGMRRRLDLAMSLIASPKVIFLDEPTTGLDPKARLIMWDIIKRLVNQGTTILLTTQYMEEADRLADRIVVIDDGKVIAEGTPVELKKRLGADRLEIVIAKDSDFPAAQTIIGGQEQRLDHERRIISIAARGGIMDLKQALGRLENAHIKVESVSLHQPTLDDVFLSLTGHATAQKVKERLAMEAKG